MNVQEKIIPVSREDLKIGMKLKRKKDSTIYDLKNVTKIDLENNKKEDYFYHFDGFIVKSKGLLFRMFEKTDNGKFCVYLSEEV